MSAFFSVPEFCEEMLTKHFFHDKRQKITGILQETTECAKWLYPSDFKALTANPKRVEWETSRRKTGWETTKGVSDMLRKTSLILVMSLVCFLWTATAYDAVYAVSNSQYSLSGAQYQLYTDSACTTKAKTAGGSNALLTTDENGDSAVLQMAPGTYYAKEIKPSKGYKLDTDENGDARVYTIQVTASDTESDPATFTSSEPPVYGEPDFMVFKTDTEDAFDYTNLLGARFTVRYYDVATKAEIAGAEPKDQWTFETVKKDAPESKPEGTFMAGFDWQHDDPIEYSHEGERPFYEVSENETTKRVLPLGWFTIEETAAPPGFWLSDKVVYGHVYQPEGGGDVITEIEGSSEDGRLHLETLTFTDEPYPSISTSASLQSGNHEVRDVITYENLVPNASYVLRGWLVDTVSGEKVPGSDSSVTLDAGTETSGQVEMVLSTEGYDEMDGYSMTAFEELYFIKNPEGESTETLVAEHKDINDSSQTVEIYQDLKIEKNVTGNLGDLSKVFEYTAELTGLVPGQAYTVEGYDEKVFNADPEGNATIPLKLMDNRSVTIRRLPKGAGYRVTEAASDHVAEFRAFSEDMADKGAKIVTASDSNGENVAKELSTALERVDLFDGTVVIVWENNRDLATITAVQSYLGIWACALAIVIAGTITLLIKHTKYKED